MKEMHDKRLIDQEIHVIGHHLVLADLHNYLKAGKREKRKSNRSCKSGNFGEKNNTQKNFDLSVNPTAQRHSVCKENDWG